LRLLHQVFVIVRLEGTASSHGIASLGHSLHGLSIFVLCILYIYIYYIYYEYMWIFNYIIDNHISYDKMYVCQNDIVTQYLLFVKTCKNITTSYNKPVKTIDGKAAELA
jgi:hypothetical protein